MRLKKNLAQMVESDYVPLSTTQEGGLLGGFGSITLHSQAEITVINPICVNPTCTNDNCTNPECRNGSCPNPQCVNDCTINNCSCTPSPEPSIPSVNADFFVGIPKPYSKLKETDTVTIHYEYL